MPRTIEVPENVANFAAYVCKDKPSAEEAAGVMREQRYTVIVVQSAKATSVDLTDTQESVTEPFEDVDRWVVYGFKKLS